MSEIWVTGTLISCLWAIASGRGSTAAQAFLASGGEALALLAELAGAMVMWSGLMAMLEQRGDAARLGGALRKLLQPLFPSLGDEEAWAHAGLNISANMLGLGNAATPAGIAAAQLFSRRGEEGLRALSFLLALNNSSLQLIPSTVMTLRAAMGAAEPADVWLPTLASSGAATLTAVLLMLVYLGRGRKRCPRR